MTPYERIAKTLEGKARHRRGQGWGTGTLHPGQRRGVPPEMPLECFNRYRGLIHRLRRE